MRVAAWKASREKAEEARTTTQSASSRTAVLKELIKQRSSGRIRGIHGRLGDLGVIDAMYDVAITTACPQLDHIVVDTAETGQRCIEFLRKNNLGRATFLLLDQLAPPKDAQATSEDVPRLFDLVKPKDAQYASAFYSVLRETLLAKDLAQANRVAFGAKRQRVVTLDGNLIETTGLMSGGGAKPQRGGMSAAFKAADDEVSPQELARLDADRDACEKAVRDVQERHKAAVARLSALTAALAAAEMELSKAAMDIRAATAQLESLQEQAKQAKYAQPQHCPPPLSLAKQGYAADVRMSDPWPTRAIAGSPTSRPRRTASGSRSCRTRCCRRWPKSSHRSTRRRAPSRRTSRLSRASCRRLAACACARPRPRSTASTRACRPRTSSLCKRRCSSRRPTRFARMALGVRGAVGGAPRLNRTQSTPAASGEDVGARRVGGRQG